ncbi:hypothetical protein EVAR_86290_1 [Eumeta japonica]|uniref:Uncharacterized protein n=1 Tax=Eumeta variegata TaxID=151549 RepID=A0A4C1UBQ5_EUMVA|nr:hypothetical protein EVAR_86290_1 [Eumeta japonica]
MGSFLSSRAQSQQTPATARAAGSGPEGTDIEDGLEVETENGDEAEFIFRIEIKIKDFNGIKCESRIRIRIENSIAIGIMIENVVGLLQDEGVFVRAEARAEACRLKIQVI